MSGILEWPMKAALSLAQCAATFDEVPVGAVVLYQNRIIATGFNRKETLNSPVSHAEIEAIQNAALALNRWRLTDCHLFVTLEPCLMCAGAIYQSRISKVSFGARDPKGGALGSLYEIHNDSRLNHNFEVYSEVLAEPCSTILKEFFKKKR